jgi:hypothetical protein
MKLSETKAAKTMNVEDGTMSLSVQCPSDATDMKLNVRVQTTNNGEARDYLSTFNGKPNYYNGYSDSLEKTSTVWKTSKPVTWQSPLTTIPRTPIAAGTPAWNNYISRHNSFTAV